MTRFLTASPVSRTGNVVYRLLALAAAAMTAMTLLALPVGGQSNGFGDVPDDAYYTLPVASLADDGVFLGTLCEEGFCPTEPIDRKTMAVWVVRVLDGRDPTATTRAGFDDVDATSFYAPFIGRMAHLGVTTGCGDGSGFCPDRNVTRAQMAAFLSRAYSLPEGPDPMFSDVSDGAWYADDVASLAGSGITAGCGDGTRFCPGRDTTRGQMATFLYRAENRLATDTCSSLWPDERAVLPAPPTDLGASTAHALASPSASWAALPPGLGSDRAQDSHVFVDHSRGTAQNNRGINIPDPVLQQAIKQQLSIREGAAILASDMTRLKFLDISGQGVTRLDGLEHATNLTDIIVQYNSITDLTPLSRLTNLKRVSVSGNSITDLAPLSRLTNLTGLYVSDNSITDLAPLSRLTNLEQLFANTNSITDLTPLSRLTNLKRLSIGGNPTDDLTAILRLTKLEELYIGGMGVTELDGFENLTNLRSLVAGYNRITDLTPLSGLTNLEQLRVGSNPITDLSAIGGLKNLANLVIAQILTGDLSVVSALQNLDTLEIGFGKVDDLSPVGDLRKLRTLHAVEAGISDLSALSGLSNLVFLDLADNLIEDISPLGKLTSLNSLNLEDNLIEDISPLGKLITVNSLNLEHNLVEDISPLGKLITVNSLNLQGNLVEDISPLGKLTALNTLNLRYNSVSDLSALERLTGLAELDVRDNPLGSTAINVQAPRLRAGGTSVHLDGAVRFTVDSEPQVYDNRVFVVPVDRDILDSEAVHLVQEDVMDELLDKFEDSFDFVLIVRNIDRFERSGNLRFLGRAERVSNTVKGIGIDSYRDSIYGTRHLKSIITLAERTGLRDGPALHEIIHYWGNRLVPGHGGHWYFSSANGLIGGFNKHDLVSLGNGRYSAGDFSPWGIANSSRKYSPIELYVAGLIPPQEVPDLLVARNGAEAISPATGNVELTDQGHPIFTADGIALCTVEDLIAKHGPRVPSHENSQKAFRGIVILVIDANHPATSADLRELNDHIRWFTNPAHDDDDDHNNFYEATGGRATITLDGLSQLYRKR